MWSMIKCAAGIVYLHSVVTGPAFVWRRTRLKPSGLVCWLLGCLLFTSNNKQSVCRERDGGWGVGVGGGGGGGGEL